MKKIIYLIAAVATLAFSTACENKKYVGSKVEKTLSVYQDGELVFEDTDIDWKIERNMEDGTYTLFMNKTHFVEAMPRLDMEVRGMVNQAETTYYVFKYVTDETIPYWNGEEFPRYVITDFYCAVAITQNAVIEFTCAGYDVYYKEIWTDIYE